MCSCSSFKCGCNWNLVSKALLVIGGLNWGVIGVGMVLAGDSSWNVLNMILGAMPMIEGILYVLVGVAAAMYIFGCRCNKCRNCVCTTCLKEDRVGEGKM